MKRLLYIVFLGVLATPAWGQFVSPDPARLKLSSANVLVLDAAADRQMYAKAADEVTPIASVTKLMTAMVVIDAQLPLDETLDIDMGDFDYLKSTVELWPNGIEDVVWVDQIIAIARPAL